MRIITFLLLTIITTIAFASTVIKTEIQKGAYIIISSNDGAFIRSGRMFPLPVHLINNIFVENPIYNKCRPDKLPLTYKNYPSLILTARLELISFDDKNKYKFNFVFNIVENLGIPGMKTDILFAKTNTDHMTISGTLIRDADKNSPLQNNDDLSLHIDVMGNPYFIVNKSIPIIIKLHD